MNNDESRLRLADYLSHMLEGVRLAREYVAGISKDDFFKDRRTQHETLGDRIAKVNRLAGAG